MPPPTLMLKLLPTASPTQNEDDWDLKEDVSLTEDDVGNTLLISIPPFICRHHLPLLSLPYPPCSRCCYLHLARICICLSSADTFIPVKLLTFCHPTICIIVRPAHCHHISVTPSYLPHLDLRQLHNILFLHPHPPPPSLSHSSIFLSTYIYISSKSLSICYLSHSLSTSLYLSSTSYSPGLLLTFPLYIIELSILSIYYSLSLIQTLSNSLCLLKSFSPPHLHYAQQQNRSRR